MLLAQMCSFKLKQFYKHFGIEICSALMLYYDVSANQEYCCSLRKAHASPFFYLRREAKEYETFVRRQLMLLLLFYCVILEVTRDLVYDAPPEC